MQSRVARAEEPPKEQVKYNEGVLELRPPLVFFSEE
jgi:hypothetical protein